MYLRGLLVTTGARVRVYSILEFASAQIGRLSIFVNTCVAKGEGQSWIPTILPEVRKVNKKV